MAFRTRHQKADHREVELLRRLVTLANQLQSSLALDAVVGVIVSAAGQKQIVFEALRLGAKDFIIKPFDPERVLKAVKRLFV